MQFHYRNIQCANMSDADVKACAELFSAHYGKWAAAAGDRAGRQIRLSERRLREMFVDKADRYVALMYDRETLIGQAFYIRRPSPWHSGRYVTFVLQLVFDKDYRGKRFGLKLLQSIFGLSNDDAWGLYTSNPLTIRALEDATFRHVDVRRVAQRLDEGLRTVLSDVFPDSSWLDSFRGGCVNTQFFVGHDDNARKIQKAYPQGGFPFKESLRDGEEWLAVVFSSQTVDVSAQRFTRAELCRLFSGYKVLLLACVSAGKWNQPLLPTERHAKEVLGVFRKRTWLQRLLDLVGLGG